MRTKLLLTVFLYLLAFQGVAFADNSLAPQANSNSKNREKDQIAQARQFIKASLLRLRSHPFDLKTSDDQQIFSTNGTIAEAYTDILPLLENDTLDAVAQTLCDSAISGTLDALGANNTRLALEAKGYIPESLHVESSGVIMREYIDPMQGADLLFKNISRSIDNGLSRNNRQAFFDNQYVEMGVGYCGGVAKLTDTQQANIYMLVLILARPQGPNPRWIQCGHVYYDINNNNLYDPGEGLEDVLMTDDNGTLLAKTLGSGQYCFRRPKDEWTLFIESFPFVQNYTIYNILLSQRKEGILWQDYPLLLTQEDIDAKREAEAENEK